jgi:hypothetical protein
MGLPRLLILRRARFFRHLRNVKGISHRSLTEPVSYEDGSSSRAGGGVSWSRAGGGVSWSRVIRASYLTCRELRRRYLRLLKICFC